MHTDPTDDNTTIPSAPLTLNPDDYRDDLKNFNLTEAQENELLQTLWTIMSTMVDIGWGVDTVQLLLPELFDQASTNFDADSENLLDSKGIEKSEKKGTDDNER